MNDILINQIKKIKFMSNDTVFEIYDKEKIGYLCKKKNDYSIAIPFENNIDVSEEFVGIKVLTNFLNYNNNHLRVLYLNAVASIDIDKFAYVGADFLDEKNRDLILNDPYRWVDDWKKIFGNSIKEKMIYDVIGELIALKCVFKYDKSAKWEGPNNGTHDIVTNEGVYEVKTTQNKNNSNITINSAFQLTLEKTEKLYFCRLELKPYTNSINSLVKEIIELGYCEEELESLLTKIGYKKGSRLRNLCYEILEIRLYDIDKTYFPIISLSELNKVCSTTNIMNYTLTIDLNCIKYKKIC